MREKSTREKCQAEKDHRTIHHNDILCHVVEKKLENKKKRF
jgi:hypothetical protein